MLYKKPSVTRLIDLLNKPALIGWANKQGLKGIDIKKQREESLIKGSSLHSQAERFIRYGDQFFNPEYQVNFENFLKDKDILGVECKVETEYFTGVYDLKFRYNNTIYLADYKSNAKRIYFEHKLQLVGYSMGTECDSFCIVSMPYFKMMNFKIKDRTPYEEILKSLSIIYKHKQEIDGTNKNL